MPLTMETIEIPYHKIEELFYYHPDQLKIKKYIKNLKDKKLRIIFYIVTNSNGIKTSIKTNLVKKNDNVEKGEFTLQCSCGISSGESIFLSIFVEDYLQGNGFSILLIGTLIGILNEQKYKFHIKGGMELNNLTILGIDGDASAGFWDSIGLKEGRYTYMVYDSKRSELSERSMEKSITLNELSKNILNKTFNCT
jgi:hypothetical protein